MSATKYGLYFNKQGTTLRVPVNPQEYPIKHSADNTRYNVLGLGEIIVPRIPKLQQISWESYFPGDINDPAALIGGGFKSPEFYINAIKDYKALKEPVRFIANRYMENGSAIFDTNIEVIVEDFDVKEKGGETGDFYYSISLTEYRDYTPQKVTVRPAVGTNSTSSSAAASAAAADSASAAVTEQRKVPNDVIAVGDTVTANGRYYYSSYGDTPSGTANNASVKVTRIIQNPTPGQSYPVCVGNLGWVQMGQLRKA